MIDPHESGPFSCTRCGHEVVRERANYATFERMHWSCFHYEFEHQGDPDIACADPSCPARSFDPKPVDPWTTGNPEPRDRRPEVLRVLDALVAEWSNGNPEDWENWTIPQYLDAMSAWLQSADASYRHRGQQVPTDGWQFFIDALEAAARYE